MVAQAESQRGRMVGEEVLLVVVQVRGVANVCPSIVLVVLYAVPKGNGMRRRSANEGAVNVNFVTLGARSHLLSSSLLGTHSAAYVLPLGAEPRDHHPPPRSDG